MQVEISEHSMSELERLRQKWRVSPSEVIDRALALVGQQDRDWDLILTDNGLNDDLSEDEADALALEAQRAVRTQRKK